MIEVVAAVIENNEGHILIARRKEDKILGGYWEFPGGKVELNEDLKECLKREIKEEMNLDILVGDYVGESIYTYNRGTIKLIAFRSKIVKGSIKLVDHEEYRWVSINELREYKLAPADVPILNYLYK